MKTKQEILLIYMSHARDRYNAALDGGCLESYLAKAQQIFDAEWETIRRVGGQLQ